MPKFELSVNLPAGTDFVRLQNSPDGWEATAICYATECKWGTKIPSQLGYAFKARSAALALQIAAEDARAKSLKIKAMRNAKPDPNKIAAMSVEELLLHELGLMT